MRNSLFRRVGLLSMLAFASVATTGCAGLNTAARAIERPAIITAEITTATMCRNAHDAIDIAQPTDRAAATSIASEALMQMSVLMVGRVAYDITLAAGSAPDVKLMVEQFRSQTDRECTQLTGAIGSRPVAFLDAYSGGG